MTSPPFCGKYVVTADGKLYHVIGNTLIEVSEHFPQNGRTIPEILNGLIQRSASQSSFDADCQNSEHPEQYD